MNKRPWWLLPPGRLNPVWWVVPGVAMIWFDHTVGPTQFPVVYFIPVTLAAWYSGKWTALTLAIAVPVFRLIAMTGLQVSVAAYSASTLFRGSVIIVLALWFDRLAEFERGLRDRVSVLEGMLPICAFCKSIQNDEGGWEGVEGYISRRSTAEFSHGLCPACAQAHYPGWMDAK